MTKEIMKVDAKTKRHFMNLGAEEERKVFRRIISKTRDDMDTILGMLDDHVIAVSVRKGGLGRK